MNVIKIIPHKNYQWLIDQVTIEFVKLTINIDHHVVSLLFLLGFYAWFPLSFLVTDKGSPTLYFPCELTLETEASSQIPAAVVSVKLQMGSFVYFIKIKVVCHCLVSGLPNTVPGKVKTKKKVNLEREWNA